MTIWPSKCIFLLRLLHILSVVAADFLSKWEPQYPLISHRPSLSLLFLWCPDSFSFHSNHPSNWNVTIIAFNFIILWRRPFSLSLYLARFLFGLLRSLGKSPYFPTEESNIHSLFCIPSRLPAHIFLFVFNLNNLSSVPVFLVFLLPFNIFVWKFFLSFSMPIFYHLKWMLFEGILQNLPSSYKQQYCSLHYDINGNIRIWIWSVCLVLL